MSSKTSETNLAQEIGFTFAVAHALDIVSDHPLGLTFAVIHALGLSSDIIHDLIFVDNKSDDEYDDEYDDESDDESDDEYDDGSDDDFDNESVCSTKSECAHCNEAECENEYM